MGVGGRGAVHTHFSPLPADLPNLILLPFPCLQVWQLPTLHGSFHLHGGHKAEQLCMGCAWYVHIQHTLRSSDDATPLAAHTLSPASAEPNPSRLPIPPLQRFEKTFINELPAGEYTADVSHCNLRLGCSSSSCFAAGGALAARPADAACMQRPPLLLPLTRPHHISTMTSFNLILMCLQEIECLRCDALINYVQAARNNWRYLLGVHAKIKKK